MKISRPGWPEITGVFFIAIFVLLLGEGYNLGLALNRLAREAHLAPQSGLLFGGDIVVLVAKPVFLVVGVLLIFVIGPLLRRRAKESQISRSDAPVEGVIYTDSEVEDFKRRGFMR